MRLKYRLQVGSQFHSVTLRAHPLQTATQLAAALAQTYPQALRSLPPAKAESRLTLRQLPPANPLSEDAHAPRRAGSLGTSGEEQPLPVDPDVLLSSLPLPTGAPVALTWVAPTDRVCQAQEGLGPQRRYSPAVSPRREPAAEQLSVPSPPAATPRRPFPWLACAVLLVVGFMLALVVQSWWAWVALLVAAGAVAGIWYWYWHQGRKLEEELTAQREHETEQFTKRAQKVWWRHSKAWEATWPTTVHLVTQLQNANREFWTIPRDDPTFLRVRVGSGTIPSGLSFTKPQGAVAVDPSPLESIEEGPIVANLRLNTALVGPQSLRDQGARALLTQALVYHGPPQLSVMVVTDRPQQWQWLQWWPHCQTVEDFLGVPPICTPEQLPQVEPTLHEVLQRRSHTVSGEYSHLLVVIDGQLPAYSNLGQLSEEFPELGLSFLYTVDYRQQASGPYQQWLQLEGVAGQWKPSGAASQTVIPELLDLEAATETALQAAPLLESTLSLNWARDLPGSVTLWQLRRAAQALRASGDPLATSATTEPLPTAAQLKRDWQRQMLPVFSLDTPLGFTSRNLMHVDLAQCDSALVSGGPDDYRQSILATWLVQLAAAFSPQQLSFLLIDSEVRPRSLRADSGLPAIAHLPHCSGLASGVSTQEQERLLSALRIEVRRRARELSARGQRDFATCWESWAGAKTGQEAALPFPALILVVPQTERYPASFLSELVHLQHTGRGLGIYLLFGDRRADLPTSTLRALGARLSLRQGSVEQVCRVLGGNYQVDPGVDFAQLGAGICQNRSIVTNFQAINVFTSDPQQGLEMSMENQGQAVRPLLVSTASTTSNAGSLGQQTTQADIARLVRAIRGAAQGLPPVQRPWLPALKTLYTLNDLPASRRLILGVSDDLEKQVQRVVTYQPAQDGSLVVCGPTGSGKTSAMRLIVAGAEVANARGGGPYSVYLLEAHSEELKNLAFSPTVGSYLPGTEPDQVADFLHWLENVVATRAEAVQRHAVARWSQVPPEQRQDLPGAAGEGSLLLAIDGLEPLLENLGANLAPVLLHILTAGKNLGVHLVVTCEEIENLPISWRPAFGKRIVLQTNKTPGRATLLDDPRPLQLAFASPQESNPALSTNSTNSTNPTTSATSATAAPSHAGTAGAGASAEKSRADAAAAGQGQTAGQDPAHRAPRPLGLAGQLTLASQMPEELDGLPVLGLDRETWQPLAFPARGTYLLAGPAQGGKTNALHYLARALRAAYPDTGLVFISYDRSSLSSLDLWDAVASGIKQLNNFLPQLSATLSHASPADYPGLGIFLADFPDFAKSQVLHNKLLELLGAVRSGGHFLVASGTTEQWYDTAAPLSALKKTHQGLLLSSPPEATVKIWGRKAPEGDLPDQPGQGWWCHPTGFYKVQLPLAGR